jgi:hypothetical protein
MLNASIAASIHERICCIPKLKRAIFGRITTLAGWRGMLGESFSGNQFGEYGV